MKPIAPFLAGLAAAHMLASPAAFGAPPTVPALLEAVFTRDLAALGFPPGPGAAGPPTEAELAALPAPARRYLAFTGAAALPRLWAFRTATTGHVHPGPGRAAVPCRAWQYASNVAIARYALTWTSPPRALPLIARDVYAEGRSWSLTELLGLLPTAGETGPILDQNELATYLGEALLVAPTLLLPPVARWYRVDDRSFEVALADHGQAVVGTAEVDAQGALARFTTADRSFLDPVAPDQTPLRARWSVAVHGWGVAAGRRRPAGWTTTWGLPAGPFAHATLELVPGGTAFNVAPGR